VGLDGSDVMDRRCAVCSELDKSSASDTDARESATKNCLTLRGHSSYFGRRAVCPK
jgi:hypothetical protein